MSASHSTRVAQSPEKGNGVPRPQPAALTVRPSAAGDLVPLCFFFDTVLRKDYFLRRGQLEDILKGRHHKVFVAEIDGILVGVAILTRGARLLNALVHPAYRGLGIGKELVSQSGAREVRAKLDMSTGDPRGFYESLGFEPTNQFNAKGNIQLMRIPSSGQWVAWASRPRTNDGGFGVQRSGFRMGSIGVSSVTGSASVPPAREGSGFRQRGRCGTAL